MNARRIALLCSVSAFVLISACSSNPPRMDASRSATVSNELQYGNVSGIEVVAGESRGAGGAVLGAVIGAVVGNNLQKRNESDVYRVSVRLDNGSTGQFDYSSIGDLRVGDRIQVQGGQLHRV